MSITQADDGTTLMHCHAGCAVSDIVAAIGITEADLFSKPQSSTDTVVVNYDYVDEEGELLYQVVRKPNKSFSHRKPDGKDGWEWSASGVRKVLYRLPQVLEAIENGETVIVTEGEKDVHTFEHYGYVATCCSGGAQGWKKEFGDIFDGANVVLCGDQDAAGRSYLRQVMESLTCAANVSKVELPPLFKDVSDWHDHRGSKRGIDFMVDTASPISSELFEETNTTFSATSIQFSDPESTNHESLLYSDRDVMTAQPMWGYEDPAPMKWAIEDTIPYGYITILGADGGTGKSYIALRLMYSVVTGTLFLGKATEQANALYLDFELEVEDQRRRWTQVLRGLGTDQNDPLLVNKVFIHKPEGSLSDPETVRKLCEMVADHSIGFIIIDSLTIGLGSDSTDQKMITESLKRLQKLGTVLAIDHVSYATGRGNLGNASVYGSVFKRNIARSMLMLGRVDGGGLVLRQNKTNFGPELDVLCLEVVFSEDGRTVTFEQRAITDDVMMGSMGQLKTLEVTDLALRSIYAESKSVVSPKEIETWRRENDAEIGERTIRNHLTQLKNNGLAVNVGENSWVPNSSSSSRSLPLGAVTSDDSGIPVFTEGQVVRTKNGLGKIEDVELSTQGRLPVRLNKENNVKYFDPGDLELPF
ncbi:MAG: AAA family ATPase [Bacteroidetes bacterium]|nr:AAA family ATPase [Bacteroidota bacterium]